MKKNVKTAACPEGNRLLPIVGIGASAGGLEALEQFLENVPEKSGVAFVIVQHLDPTHEGVLCELLQRTTGMKVVQVKDSMTVEPDCVYVIPPNKDISILHGVLHLFAPAEPRGLRLPIDFFLRSLAQDCQEHSIGVILSGMGSDGTLGLRAIKEKAGLALVQAPETAKFDAMPRSAINAGLADITAPADELPGKIIAFLKRIPLLPQPVAGIEDRAQNVLEKVLILLRARTGHDFTLYKKNTLYRRIERRMGLHQISKMSSYLRYLQENSQELDLLFNELLIGVTSFFRDPAAWEELRNKVLPDLLANRAPGQTLRAWVPGCSTGEEAYSLAMIFKEATLQMQPKVCVDLQIFATDLDQDAIDKARQGFFPDNIVADVSVERLRRFFIKDVCGYRISKEIRKMVIFAPQNLIMDPPFTRLDILCCRNLLIYLGADVQKKLIPMFHYSLNPGGVLFLGSSEAIGRFSDFFETLDTKLRIFRRLEVPLPNPVEFPAAFGADVSARTQPHSVPKPPVSLQAVADQLVLERYAPPAVLANASGDIFYISGRTGKYLEPAAGKANWNLFVMIREGLRYELTAAFQKALRQKECIILQGLKVGEQLVNLTVQQLDENGPLKGLVMIVFTDVVATIQDTKHLGKPRARNAQNAEIEHDILQLRAEVQTRQEEMQAMQEECMSANEELQSANEELQSTNEELTTSKEEMNSMNDQLHSINAQLEAKLEELSRLNNDMKNLLDSTNIATLFLDYNLNVQRFTPQAAKLIKLIPADVGRPITDLASELHYPELSADAQAVLQTLNPVEKSIAADDDRWFTVRIMPYRTLDDRIDGVVITFVDITVAKTLEARLRTEQVQREEHFAEQSLELAQRKKNNGVRTL